MNKLQGKSPYCQAKIYKIGGKRRQCSECKKTWKIRQKKRGRKAKRVDKKLVENILVRGERASHVSNRKIGGESTNYQPPAKESNATL
jgi:transposase-like protein